LTRGDVQGLPEEIQLKIYAKENCVLVHSGQCHIEAATIGGQRKCNLQLLEFVGSHAIWQWLEKMRPWIPESLYRQAFLMGIL